MTQPIKDRSGFDALRDALWKQIADGISDPEVKAVVQDVIVQMKRQDEMSDFFSKSDVMSEIEQRVADRLNNEQKFQLTNVMTLLVHTSRTASITATKKYVKNKPLEELVATLKESGLGADRIIEQFKRPAMDNVFTTHPTYIGDLAYAKKLRAFDRAVFQAYVEEKEGAAASVKAAIDDLLSSNSLVEKRLTAQDEAYYMRHYLKNCYESLPYIYENFDAALHHNGIEYDPLELRLNVNFQSWGSSGDKDGNVNITAMSLEDAAKLHRRTIISSYKDDFRKMVERLPESDEKVNFQTEWQALSRRLDSLWRHPVNPVGGHEVPALLKDLKSFAQQVYAFTRDKDAAQYGRSARKALGMRRCLDVFGLNLGQIEFRETADELEFILNHFITPNVVQEVLGDKYKGRYYSQLDNLDDKETVLNYAMEHIADMEERLRKAYEKIPQHVKTRDYKYADSGVKEGEKDKPKSEQEPDDNNAIFFHTIERLLLAKSNPDMFRGQVLAEAVNPAQVKEMLLLLKLTGTDKQIRLIPLFEDPNVLADINNIMYTLNHDPYIFRHLVDVSLVDWERDVGRGIKPALPKGMEDRLYALADAVGDEKKTDEALHALKEAFRDKKKINEARHALGEALAPYKIFPGHIIHNQIQLAHSDNARRGGTAGARARLYKAHHETLDEAYKLGIGMHFFEGGSHTDSFRMGVRSYKSQVNMYETHDFMKSTVQGMDLTQIFSTPLTIEAFIEENIANSVRILSERGKRLEQLPERRRKIYRTRSMTESDAITQAVIDEVERYRKDYFGGDGKDPKKNPPNIVLGNIMAQIFHYEENKQSGTVGSRSGSRGKGKKDQSLYLNPVTDTRTIGYSETFQHGRLNPNYIGSKRIYDTLTGERLDKIIDKECMTLLRREFVGKTAQQKLHFLYKKNPFLNDGIDRVAYAVATTDFDHVWDSAMYDYSSGKREPRVINIGDGDKPYKEERITERPKDIAKLKALAAQKERLQDASKEFTAEQFLAWLEVEYRDAGKMVMEAITGEKYTIEQKTTREITKDVRQELGRYQDALHQQDVIMRVGDAVYQSTSAKDREAERKDGGGLVSNAMNKAIHNLRDMATLIRPPFQREIDYIAPELNNAVTPAETTPPPTATMR